MSVYDDWASILRKAQGAITEDGWEVDVGAEVVRLRREYEAQQARIDLLVQWVQQDCPWDKEVILETIERERAEAK